MASHYHPYLRVILFSGTSTANPVLRKTECKATLWCLCVPYRLHTRRPSVQGDGFNVYVFSITHATLRHTPRPTSHRHTACHTARRAETIFACPTYRLLSNHSFAPRTIRVSLLAHLLLKRPRTSSSGSLLNAPPCKPSCFRKPRRAWQKIPTPHDPPTDLTHFQQQLRKRAQDIRYNAAVGSGTPGPRPFPAFCCCLTPPPRRPIKAPPLRVTTRSPKARRTAHDRLGIVNVLPAGVTSYATSARDMDSREGGGYCRCESLGGAGRAIMSETKH
ncbi:unnamed protein product [Ectocarpus sp. 12 AP-2014]